MAIKTVRYSLVIPAFQEEFVIANTLVAVEAYLKKQKLLDNTEVIVVTADSNDKTARLVKSKASLFPNFQFIEPGPKVGKGRDVGVGIMAARGKYILFTDADLATPLKYIKPAFSLLEAGNDVVIGIRDLTQIHSGIRKFISLSANYITRFIIAPFIEDTQCGFKGFRKSAAKDIFSKLTVLGWAFDMEVIACARQKRFKIAKLHIPDWREKKPTHLQLAGESGLKSAVCTFIEALKIWRNVRSRKYTKTSQQRIQPRRGSKETLVP